MNTKEKIIKKALNLFNKDGVERITTRHIAKKIGMSQGNLHYHYPNKNELILTLTSDFITEINENKKFDNSKYLSKEVVLATTKLNFKIMYKYRFLFIDNEVVWRRIPSVGKDITSLMNELKMRIKLLIDHYKTIKVFRSEISTSQIDYLAEQFIFSITTWLIAARYMDVKKDVSSYYAEFVFRNWLPYLTLGEMKEWEKLVC